MFNWEHKPTISLHCIWKVSSTTDILVIERYESNLNQDAEITFFHSNILEDTVFEQHQTDY